MVSDDIKKLEMGVLSIKMYLSLYTSIPCG